MEIQGICSPSHTPPLLSRAALVELVGGAIGGSLAFIPPPNGVPFWWGHFAVLGNDD